MGKVYVVTNPTPLHNNSPVVSLSKFVQVLCGAGYTPVVSGARLPKDGLPGVPDDVIVKSYRYGGKSIFKMASFAMLQMKMFFSGLFRYRKGDSVYFWIADKMLGAFLAAKLKRAEINYFLYGRTFKDGTGGLSAKLIIYMMNRADYVCVESPAVFDQWNPDESVPRSAIRLFVPESDVQSVPFSERGKSVAMFSRLCPGKHIDDAVKAFCKVREQFPDYDMTIIGGGVLEDEVRELIRELNAEDYITVTGWLSPDEAKRRIAECRVLLYPTDAEGVPGSVLESMSLGVPALASPAGGIPDVIDDGADGRILSDTTPDVIEKELASMLSCDRLEQMAEAAKKKIAEQYSRDAAVANFLAVIESRNVKKD